jgi:transcriptional regulator with XRE-family HTH domain
MPGRHRELAQFLRSRRERLSPADFGLPVGPRRRTPGLRREEVAQLAGVGVTWYTWLEQGREITVSAQVLGAVAQTLRLDPGERSHLFTLAGVFDNAVPCEAQPLPGAVLATLEAVRPFPAYVVNGRWDLLAHNPEAEEILGGFAGVPRERLNIMWLAFVERTLDGRVVEFDAESARHVALFRAGMADHPDHPAWKRLRDDLLAASPLFREYWDRYEVSRPMVRSKTFIHPRAGRIHVETASFMINDGPPLARLVVYSPADETARAAMRILSPSPGAAVVALA